MAAQKRPVALPRSTVRPRYEESKGVHHWFEAGRLPGLKLGRAVRFRASEVEAWLEARRVTQMMER